MTTINLEQVARSKIDQILIDSVWQVQSKGKVNLFAIAGGAIRESNKETGAVGYILVVNSMAVGVMEANPEDLGLTPEEYAFYSVLKQNDSTSFLNDERIDSYDS